MAEVIFNLEGDEIKIQCDISDKMETIIQRFLIKVQEQTTNMNLVYLYGGSCVKKEINFSEQANIIDKERKKKNILVTKNEESKEPIKVKSIKDITCPECKEDILIEIKNFKIKLYGCKNNHNINNISITEFEETQKTDLTKIICDICKIRNKSNSFNNDFYFCNKCNINICPLCKSKHDLEHTIINYDDKNYLCKKHNDSFTKFCKNCSENLCIMCESKHNGHTLFDLGKILVDKDELLEMITNLKNVIDTIKLKIKRKYLLDKIEDKINIYYKINKDYISNYNMNKRNFHKLQNLIFLKNHNEKIIRDFNKIINSDNMKELYDFIFINFYNPNDEKKHDLRDEKKNNFYDVIILGTGLKESALAYLLAKDAKKIFEDEKKEEVRICQLDKNNFVGSEIASLDLKNIYNYFQEEKTDDLSYLFDKNEDWHIDLTSKFILANGTLVKMILKSDINEFIDFKGIDGMYIYHFSKGGFFSKAHGGIYEVSQSGTTSFIGKSEKTKLKN